MDYGNNITGRLFKDEDEEDKKDQEYLSKLKELREIAVYQGREDLVDSIDADIDRKLSVVADRESGVGAEVESAIRTMAKYASLGIIEDEDIAAFYAGGDESKYSEKLERIRKQDLEAGNNNVSQGIAAFLGGGSAAVSGSFLAGRGKTYLGTFLRQAGVEGTGAGVLSYNINDAKLENNAEIVDFINTVGSAAVIGGGLGAVTMGRAVEWGTTPSSRPLRSTRDGGKTEVDNASDEVLSETNAAMEEATRRQVNDAFWDAADSQRKMSQLDDRPYAEPASPVDLKRKSWRDATTAGELVDNVVGGLKNFYREQLNPTFFRLKDQVSPDVGARYQRGIQGALMETTNEIKKFVEPAEDVFELNRKDIKFQELLVDYGANSPHVKRKDVLDYVEKKLSKEDADALNTYMDWSLSKAHFHLREVSGYDNPNIFDQNYLSTKLSPIGKERLGKKEIEDDVYELQDDSSLKRRKRNYIKNPDPKNPNPAPRGDDYLPVLQSDLSRIINNQNISHVQKAFKVPAPEKTVQPKEWMNNLQQHFISKGVPPERAQFAADLIKENLVGATRSPNLILQTLNSIGYTGSLAGPKSAILNLHDPIVLTANMNTPLREIPGQLKRAYITAYKGEGPDVIKSGIDQNVGEFTNKHIDTITAVSTKEGAQKWAADTARTITDKAMKISLFEKADIYSKNAGLTVILEQMTNQARAGTLAKDWRFYFDPTDFNKVNAAIKKHGTDWKAYKGKDFELMESLVFGALGQQQLLSVAGRPAGWSRNPNIRPMWALRGFAMQQQGLAMYKAQRAFHEGNPQEAYNYLGRYALIAGTSFGLLNEARQWLFGDGKAELTGVFMGMADQIMSTASINTLGLNDYQFGRIMEVGIGQAFLESLVPIAADIPYGIGKDVLQTLQNDQGPLYPIAQFPLVKQPINFVNNTTDRAVDFAGMLSLGQADISPYIKDPQQEVMKKMGLMKDNSQD